MVSIQPLRPLWTAALWLSMAPLLSAAEPLENPSLRWEPHIAAFEEKDRESPPPKDAILFVGSSSIRLWKLEKAFPQWPTINRGFGGSQMIDSCYYADRLVTCHRPRLIVVYAGDNDLAAGKSPEQVCQDFQSFVAEVRDDLPQTPILFISIKPSPRRIELLEKMRQANQLVEAVCRKDQTLKYVDVFSPMLGDDGQPREELFIFDGLHLNAAGYNLWKSVLTPYLKPASPSTSATVPTSLSPDATERN